MQNINFTHLKKRVGSFTKTLGGLPNGVLFALLSLNSVRASNNNRSNNQDMVKRDIVENFIDTTIVESEHICTEEYLDLYRGGGRIQFDAQRDFSDSSEIKYQARQDANKILQNIAKNKEIDRILITGIISYGAKQISKNKEESERIYYQHIHNMLYKYITNTLDSLIAGVKIDSIYNSFLQTRIGIIQKKTKEDFDDTQIISRYRQYIFREIRDNLEYKDNQTLDSDAKIWNIIVTIYRLKNSLIEMQELSEHGTAKHRAKYEELRTHSIINDILSLIVMLIMASSIMFPSSKKGNNNENNAGNNTHEDNKEIVTDKSEDEDDSGEKISNELS